MKEIEKKNNPEKNDKNPQPVESHKKSDEILIVEVKRDLILYPVVIKFNKAQSIEKILDTNPLVKSLIHYEIKKYVPYLVYEQLGIADKTKKLKKSDKFKSKSDLNSGIIFYDGKSKSKTNYALNVINKENSEVIVNMQSSFKAALKIKEKYGIFSNHYLFQEIKYHPSAAPDNIVLFFVVKGKTKEGKEAYIRFHFNTIFTTEGFLRHKGKLLKQAQELFSLPKKQDEKNKNNQQTSNLLETKTKKASSVVSINKAALPLFVS